MFLYVLCNVFVWTSVRLADCNRLIVSFKKNKQNVELTSWSDVSFLACELNSCPEMGRGNKIEHLV